MDKSMIMWFKKAIYDFIGKIVPVSVFDKMWSKYFIWTTKHRKKESLSGAYYVKNTCRGNKDYYLCRLSVEAGNGYFAIANRMLFCYEWAVSNGLIPLIDIEYKDAFLKQEYGKYNRWEYGFSQNTDIASVFKNGNVLVDAIESMQFSRKLCKAVNGKHEDIYIHAKIDGGKQYYKKLNEISRNIWIFNDNLQRKIDNNRETLFNDEMRVVGVVLREEFGMPKEKMSLEQSKVYGEHPRAISLEETYEVIKKHMQKWNCTHVFIATMFQDSIDFFVERLGEKVLFAERKRESFSCFIDMNKRLFEGYLTSDLSLEKNAWDAIGYTEEKVREQTEEYVLEMALVSECAYCMGVKCSGFLAACVMNGGKFEDIVVFNDENQISRY